MASQDWFEKDFYAILGVPKDADAAAIKKAYRKLARTLHPDAQRRGTPRPSSGSRRSARPTRSCPTPSSASSTTRSASMSHGGARFTAGGPGGGGGAPASRTSSAACSAGRGRRARQRPLHHRRRRRRPAQPRGPARRDVRQGGAGPPRRWLRRLRCAARPAARRRRHRPRPRSASAQAVEGRRVTLGVDGSPRDHPRSPPGVTRRPEDPAARQGRPGRPGRPGRRPVAHRPGRAAPGLRPRRRTTSPSTCPSPSPRRRWAPR